MKIMKSICSLGFWLLTASVGFSQARYLLAVEQPEVVHRLQRTWVQPLAFGQVVAAVLLSDRSAVELLVVDGCDAVLSRHRLYLDGAGEILGFERFSDGHLLLGVHLADGSGAVLIKITPDRAVVWANRYRFEFPVKLGSLSVNTQGDAVLSGGMSGAVGVCLAKIAPSGEVVWARRAKSLDFPGAFAVALSDGGALQVSHNFLWKWSEQGTLQWHAQVRSKGLLLPDDLRPAEVSDGYVFAVRLDPSQVHLVKIDPSGGLRWFTPTGIPVLGLSTYTILRRTHLQKLLPYRGDTLLLAGMARGGMAAMHLVDPKGKVVVQRFFTDSYPLEVQDFCTGEQRVYLAGARGEQTFLMGVRGDLKLGCGDTLYSSTETSALGRISVRQEPLPEVSSMVVKREPFSVGEEERALPAVTYLCLSNDTTGIEKVVELRQAACIGEVVYLRPDAPKGALIEWDDGRRDTVFRAEGPGLYTAQITYCALQWKVQYQLEPQDCHCRPIYPTAFTPDGDGINDGFAPIAVPECAYRAFEWSVFNRWGQRLFVGNSPTDAWDGRLSGGQPAPSDVYVWLLRYALPMGDKELWFTEKGELTLLR